MVDRVKSLVAKAKDKKVELVLPTDVVVAASIKKGEPTRTVGVGDIGESDMALDLGPDAAADISNVVSAAKTVFWNGTLGYSEIEIFAKSSSTVAEAIIKSGAKSIIGGGDTSGFLDQYSRPDKFSFISTGGGAALELLAGKELPGIVSLQN